MSIYNLQTERKLKTLQMDNSKHAPRHVVDVKFSADGNFLMMQCGAPDWVIMYWRWYACYGLDSLRATCDRRKLHVLLRALLCVTPSFPISRNVEDAV